MPRIVYEADASNHISDDWYRERVDRNLGWITPDEQTAIRKMVIGVAGCGGMGGLLAATFIRLGVGEVRIADSEVFDISNLNRQFAANSHTVGKSKALETANMLRTISTDTKLIVYPEGIVHENADEFVDGCDFISDEIELLAVGARIMLHQVARARKIPLITCSSVGFGTRFLLFDHTGMKIEDMFNMSLDEAMALQDKVQNRTIAAQEARLLVNTVLDALIPELTRYSVQNAEYDDRTECVRRLLDEQKAPIIATNPPMASGFAANYTLLYLLRKSNFREIVSPPRVPGYLYFDAARMDARIVERSEVFHGEQ